MAIVFLALSLITVVMRFLFPLPMSAKGWTVNGWSYNVWAEIHFYLYCVFSLLALVHVMLHWSWVCGVASSRISKWNQRPFHLDYGSQTIYGVGTLIVFLGFFGILYLIAALRASPPP